VRRRAFFVADAMMGLAFLALLATVLAVTATRQQRAARVLADQREAVRIAETALLDLQAHQSATAAGSDVTVRVAPAAGGANVPGRKWVEMIVTVRGQTRSLVGLVPDDAATGEGGAP
jgi:Tfp pilus assembly protein PilX